MLAAVATLLVALSLVQFLPFVRPARGLLAPLAPVRRVLMTVRSVNAYHLFAQMTLVRREAVVEGSADPSRPIDLEGPNGPSDPSEPSGLISPDGSGELGSPSDAAEALQELEARDRERTLARYGWTGLRFTDREVASNMRACVEKVCEAYMGHAPGSDTRHLRRGYSRRFST